MKRRQTKQELEAKAAEREAIAAIRRRYYESRTAGVVEAEPEPAAAPSRTSEPRSQQAVVVIPADWQENLPWPSLRSLASQVSDTPIRNRADAVAAIQTELSRRAST